MDTRLAKRNYNIQQWKTIIQDRNNTNLTDSGSHPIASEFLFGYYVNIRARY